MFLFFLLDIRRIINGSQLGQLKFGNFFGGETAREKSTKLWGYSAFKKESDCAIFMILSIFFKGSANILRDRFLKW